MFTGIVETTATLVKKEHYANNINLYLSVSFLHELKIDQSIAHNGVCLTVVEINNDTYKVTAVAETLNKTNLSNLQVGDRVNIERCMALGGRLDGHIVQGHVDCTGKCTSITNKEGSWIIAFEYDKSTGHLTVPKGSICVNGVSLTVVDSLPGYFTVTIIPYTFNHTCFKALQVGDDINLEFDILGKYILRYMEVFKNQLN
ncbi:MAG: riboflavin synthase [Bacteroidia bacterium]|nr:riboflavin synthase [Bacteroidia bacterium]